MGMGTKAMTETDEFARKQSDHLESQRRRANVSQRYAVAVLDSEIATPPIAAMENLPRVSLTRHYWRN